MRPNQAAIFGLALATATHTAESRSLVDRASAHVARAHGYALKHSAAFARDLRTTFRSVLPPRAPPSAGIRARDAPQAVLDEGHKLFCTVPKSGPTPGSNSNSTHSSSTSSKGSGPTSTKSGGGGGGTQTGTSSAPSATSSWKVFHTYVSSAFFACFASADLNASPETTFSTTGTSSPARTPPTAR
jgi:hypothetical protein